MSSKIDNSSTPDWKNAPHFGRRDTIMHTLRRSHQLCDAPPCIVETGCSRDERPEACNGDGWSTRAWGWYAEQTGGRAYTVDISEEAIEACKRITSEYAGSLEYTASDSLEYLGNWPQQERGLIDLLYLDSLDYSEPERSEKHHLAEAMAALPHLAPVCLVLFDDTCPNSAAAPPNTGLPAPARRKEGPRAEEYPTPNIQYPTPNTKYPTTGKGALAIPFLLENGFQIEWLCGGQALLSRGAEEIPPEIDLPNPVSALISARLQRTSQNRWLQMPALCFLPHAFREFEATADANIYLETVARLCGNGGSSIEVGSTSAHGPAWLRRRGVNAAGMLLDPDLLERARQAAFHLGSDAEFIAGNPFAMYRDAPRDASRQSAVGSGGIPLSFEGEVTKGEAEILGRENAHKGDSGEWPVARSGADCALFPVTSSLSSTSSLPPRYTVIHHCDLVSTLPSPWLRSVLAQQVALADWVVFAVDSVFAPPNAEMEELGGRRIPVEEWGSLLSDFEIADLRTYGPTGKERILVTLRGQQVTRELRHKMCIGPEPYPFGISLIVHTRNEAHQLADCLNSAAGLADEIIVCDMQSEDGTPELADQLGARVIRHPLIDNWDGARNASAMFAKYKFVFYLDADERIPVGLAPILRHLLASQGHLFEAMALPFRNMFAGKELSCTYGYKAASIYRNGTFYYNARPHQGARIDGRVVYFPADNPNVALPHLSYLDLSHYIRKMDGYTSTEAANMHADGRPFHWKQMMAHAMVDMQSNFDLRGGHSDGPAGMLWALQSGFYRIVQHGKLWHARSQSGQLQPEEEVTPGSLEEMLEFALSVVRGEGRGEREQGTGNRSSRSCIPPSSGGAGTLGIVPPLCEREEVQGDAEVLGREKAQNASGSSEWAVGNSGMPASRQREETQGDAEPQRDAKIPESADSGAGLSVACSCTYHHIGNTFASRFGVTPPSPF